MSPQCLENVVNAGGILKPEELVGEALKQAGVAITITTLTDVFAFGIGATTVSQLPALFNLTYFGFQSISDLYLENTLPTKNPYHNEIF